MTIETAFFGVLGRDAERKISKAGKPYLLLNVRVGNGDTAQWLSVLSFDERAVELADRLTKGIRIYVEGSLRMSEWTGSDGTARQGLNVMSWHTRLPQIGRNKPRRPKAETSAGPAAPSSDGPSLNDDIPF